MQSLKLLALFVTAANAVISYNYISRPDLHAAPWNVTFLAENADLADAYVFIAPNSAQLTGLMIYENNGEPVFIANSTLLQGATNFRVQPFEGQNYLTFWAGKRLLLCLIISPSIGTGAATTGHGSGFDYMLKKDYTLGFKLMATNLSDLHEVRYGSVSPPGN